MATPKSTAPPSPIRRAVGLLLSLALAVTGVLLLPWLMGLAGSWWVGIALMTLAVPAFIPFQAMLQGNAKPGLRTFVSLYMEAFTLLSLQLLAILLTMPLFVLDMIFILGFMALLLGPVALCLYVLQQCGMEIGRPVNGQETLLFLGLSLGVALVEWVYWKRHESVVKAREWVLTTLVDFFR